MFANAPRLERVTRARVNPGFRSVHEGFPFAASAANLRLGCARPPYYRMEFTKTTQRINCHRPVGNCTRFHDL